MSQSGRQRKWRGNPYTPHRQVENKPIKADQPCQIIAQHESESQKVRKSNEFESWKVKKFRIFFYWVISPFN